MKEDFERYSKRLKAEKIFKATEKWKATCRKIETYRDDRNQHKERKNSDRA